MKTLNLKNENNCALDNARILTFEEVEQVSGGTDIGDGETHGRGCGCMTCRIKEYTPEG